MSAPSTADKHPCSKHFDDVIRIVVGSQVVFYIHRGVLSFYSDHFNKVLNESLKGAMRKTLALEDEDETIFAIFRGWLYARELRDANDNVGRHLAWTTLTRLWVFGDKHLVPLLQNNVTDTIITKVVAEQRFDCRELPYIYANTVPGAKLRTLFIDLAATGLNAESALVDCEAMWNRERLLDLSRALFAKRRNFDLAGNHCVYHVHERGVRCEVKVPEFPGGGSKRMKYTP
ncbi:hypothetical protein MBLNU459_g1327t1 [Dothideomycetes sp. NU459]